MTSTTEAGFLHDIREHPEDDAPRLIYADWLEEHGDETDRARADLIRVQCRLAQLPDDDPEREDLEEREKGLLRRLDDWLGPVRAACRAVELHRGFVSAATIDAEQLL